MNPSIDKPITLDLLADDARPALSTMSDMPVVETLPDAANKGAPPQKIEDTKAAPAQDAGKTNSESATEHTEEAEAPAPGEPEDKAAKPPRGVQKRLDELTRQAREAERREAEARAEASRLLAMLERAGQPPAKAEAQPEKPADVELPVKPNRAEFADPDAYDAALAEHFRQVARMEADARVQEAIRQSQQAAQQAAVEAAQRAALDAHRARIEKTKAKYADYAEVAESPDVIVSQAVASAIVHSEHGPDIAYYLGSNKAEAARIMQLNPVQQLVEVGAIVARLNSPAPSAAPKATLTQAPRPPKPISSGSTSEKSVDDMSMEEYAAHRKKQLAAERKPGGAMRH